MLFMDSPAWFYGLQLGLVAAALLSVVAWLGFVITRGLRRRRSAAKR